MLIKRSAKLLGSLLIIAVLVLLSACSGKEKLTAHPIELTNSTGQVFDNIMIIPTGSDEVSDDYLPAGGIPDGSVKSLPFSGDTTQEKWDIVIKSGENTLIWSEISMFEVSSVTLFYSEGKTSFEAK